MRDFRGLVVWQKAHGVTLQIYRASNSFPGEERFGLTAQLRRAALSIPTNVAEGCGRQAEGDFRRFLKIASGSASETEYLLLLASELNYLDADSATDLIGQVQEVKRMLSSFAKRLRQRDRAKSRLTCTVPFAPPVLRATPHKGIPALRQAFLPSLPLDSEGLGTCKAPQERG